VCELKVTWKWMSGEGLEVSRLRVNGSMSGEELEVIKLRVNVDYTYLYRLVHLSLGVIVSMLSMCRLGVRVVG